MSETQTFPVQRRVYTTDMKARFRVVAEAEIERILAWSRDQVAQWEQAIADVERDVPDSDVVLRLGHPPYGKPAESLDLADAPQVREGASR